MEESDPATAPKPKRYRPGASTTLNYQNQSVLEMRPTTWTKVSDDLLVNGAALFAEIRRMERIDCGFMRRYCGVYNGIAYRGVYRAQHGHFDWRSLEMSVGTVAEGKNVIYYITNMILALQLDRR